ncbi:MAG: hypothetical protein J6B98_02005 [Bacilli bacterium]|nr:hypothetical protein [Bacilli bacterium]
MAKRRLKKILSNNITTFFKSIEAELSNSELVKSIFRLVEINSHNSIRKNLNEIINENPDCLYNGDVYRKIDLNVSQILNDMGEDVSIKNLINCIKKYIQTGQYQSATKSIDSATGFAPDSDVESPISVTIRFKAENGVDIQELAKKYYELLKDDENESLINKLKVILEYEKEQEIYTLIPDNYDIVLINNVPIEEFPDPLTEDVIKQINPQENYEDKEEYYDLDYKEDKYKESYDDSIPF